MQPVIHHPDNYVQPRYIHNPVQVAETCDFVQVPLNVLEFHGMLWNILEGRHYFCIRKNVDVDIVIVSADRQDELTLSVSSPTPCCRASKRSRMTS